MADLDWEQGLIRVADAVRFLSVSRSKLYQLMDARKLAYLKLGRSRRIPRSELTRLINENMVSASGE
jgi:excisionase family DNA binding protein